jgi:hypothetical protein
MYKKHSDLGEDGLGTILESKPFKLASESDFLPSKQHDPVNKPKHYTQGKIEVLDFILDQKMNFLEANIIKYTARYKYKNGIEDLRKAAYYLNRLIEETEKSK